MNKEIRIYSSDSFIKQPSLFLAREFRNLLRIRQLVWILFVRDLKAQYRQSIIGYVWLVVPPLTLTLVWFFLNNQRIIRVETEIPYPLFVLIGTTIWSSLAALVQQPIVGFNHGKAVFIKLDVPPEAFIFSCVLMSLFELLIRIALLVPMFIFYQFVPPPSALWFGLGLLTVILPAVAVGICLVPLGSLYGDVSNAIRSFIGILMFTAPVVYPIPEGGGLLAEIMLANPLTPGISLCRDVLTTGSYEWAPLALGYSAVAVAMIAVSLVMLRIAKPHLVERMGM